MTRNPNYWDLEILLAIGLSITLKWAGCTTFDFLTQLVHLQATQVGILGGNTDTTSHIPRTRLLPFNAFSVAKKNGNHLAMEPGLVYILVNALMLLILESLSIKWIENFNFEAYLNLYDLIPHFLGKLLKHVSPPCLWKVVGIVSRKIFRFFKPI